MAELLRGPSGEAHYLDDAGCPVFELGASGASYFGAVATPGPRGVSQFVTPDGMIVDSRPGSTSAQPLFPPEDSPELSPDAAAIAVGLFRGLYD